MIKGLNKRLIASLFLVMIIAIAVALVSIASSLTSSQVSQNGQGVVQQKAVPGSNQASAHVIGAQQKKDSSNHTNTNQNKGTSTRATNAPPMSQQQKGANSSHAPPIQNAKAGHSAKNGTKSQMGPGVSGTGAPMMGQQSGSQSSGLIKNLVIGFSILFFVGFLVLTLFLRKRKIRVRKKTMKLLMLTLSVIGLCTRLAIAPWVSGHMDLTLFQNWAQSASSGFLHFYQNSSADYPPLYVYVLYVIGKAVTLPGLSSGYTLLLKLPSIIADVLTAWLIYRLAKKKGHESPGLLAAAFYVFNPAVWMDSVIWGQVDSFFTLIIVLALTCLIDRRYFLSTALFAAAVMMKPQGIIFLPVLAYVFIMDRKIGKGFLALGWYALVTALIALPFSFYANGGALWLVQLMKRTISEYPYASVNAFNVYSLLGGNYQSDSASLFLFSYHTWGLIAITLVSLASLWLMLHARSIRSAAIASLMQIAGVFTFASGMHERYLYPAIALALLSWLLTEDRRFGILAAGYSLTIFMNIVCVYYLSGNLMAPYSWPLVVTSIMNILLFIVLIWTAFGKETTQWLAVKDSLRMSWHNDAIQGTRTDEHGH
ncbi:glycosyltransferase family 39 protein [Sporolactobacillus sp. STCC-11]|uniref:glycosyltransferase family 39 protein n=1 Tax=Sporolactobacillus caesalpiniae TaxID=3230362 RepID=UPI003391E0BE